MILRQPSEFSVIAGCLDELTLMQIRLASSIRTLLQEIATPFGFPSEHGFMYATEIGGEGCAMARAKAIAAALNRSPRLGRRHGGGDRSGFQGNGLVYPR